MKTHQDFDENTAGCGPAHRCMPLAGFIKIPTNELIDLARQEAKITHYHEDAGNGSAIVVLLCRHLSLLGYHPMTYIQGQYIKTTQCPPNQY